MYIVLHGVALVVKKIAPETLVIRGIKLKSFQDYDF